MVGFGGNCTSKEIDCGPLFLNYLTQKWPLVGKIEFNGGSMHYNFLINGLGARTKKQIAPKPLVLSIFFTS